MGAARAPTATRGGAGEQINQTGREDGSDRENVPVICIAEQAKSGLNSAGHLEMGGKASQPTCIAYITTSQAKGAQHTHTHTRIGR